MLDFDEVEDEKGEKVGVVIVGNAEEMTSIMIAQLQQLSRAILALSMWSTDKEQARDVVKEFARLMNTSMERMVPSVKAAMRPDGLPMYYTYMEADFERAWAVREKTEPEIRERMEKEGGLRGTRKVTGNKANIIH